MSGGVSFFFFKNMNDKKKTGFFRFRSLNATATAFDTRSPNSISFSSSPWAKTSEACTWSCGGRWTVVWEGTKKGGKLKRFFFLREKEQREKKRHSRKKKKTPAFFSLSSFPQTPPKKPPLYSHRVPEPLVRDPIVGEDGAEGRGDGRAAAAVAAWRLCEDRVFRFGRHGLSVSFLRRRELFLVSFFLSSPVR